MALFKKTFCKFQAIDQIQEFSLNFNSHVLPLNAKSCKMAVKRKNMRDKPHVLTI